MTEEEKVLIIDAVIAKLKLDSTDISSSEIVEDINGVSYVLCYKNDGSIIRVSPENVGAMSEEDKQLLENSVDGNDISFSRYEDKVDMEFSKNSGNVEYVSIHAATTTEAGVMSVEDKKKLEISFSVEGKAIKKAGISNVYSFAITELIPLPKNGIKVRAYDGGSKYDYCPVAFFSDEGNFIESFYTGESTPGVRDVEINTYPEGAVFYKASTQISKLSDSKVYYSFTDIVDNINLLNDRLISKTINLPLLENAFIVEDLAPSYSTIVNSCISNGKPVGKISSNVYEITANVDMIVTATNLSNNVINTQCWAVYDGAADVNNFISALSDTDNAVRSSVSVELHLKAGYTAVFSHNTTLEMPTFKVKKALNVEEIIEPLVESVNAVTDGKVEVNTPITGNSEGLTVINNFVIDTSGGSPSDTYDTFYFVAEKEGRISIESRGKASLVRIAVSSSIGSKPQYYEYTQTNAENYEETELIYTSGQYVVVSANIGKLDWVINNITKEIKLKETLVIPQLEPVSTAVKNIEENIEENIKKSINKLHNEARNAYKGFAPKPFKDKLLACNDDINIVLFGDSVTAFTNVGEELPNAANLPAGCQHYAITYQLWNYLCKNKQQCDRFDSAINTFVENGTFTLSDVNKQNGTETNKNYGEQSPDNCLYRETSTPNDSFSFTWNLDYYEKLNLIGRMSIYGSRSITISCDSGKILVQHNNRANPKEGIEDNAWVEANGYTFTQYLDYSTSAYNAWYVRNFPIKFKRVDGATGEITITVTNTCSASDVNAGNANIPSTTMFYWGTERWNGTTVRVTNCARAGRATKLLLNSIKQELLFRDIDLVIWQLPLWNELKAGGNPFEKPSDEEESVHTYHNNMISKLNTYSEDFTKFQVIVNMVHTQLASWKGNCNIPFQANGLVDRPKTDFTDWECCSKLFKNILDNENYGENKLVAANLYNEVYNYAQANGLTMEELLDTEADTNIGDGTTNSGADSEGFTTDGTHPSSFGFEFYASLIAPMMY